MRSMKKIWRLSFDSITSVWGSNKDEILEKVRNKITLEDVMNLPWMIFFKKILDEIYVKKEQNFKKVNAEDFFTMRNIVMSLDILKFKNENFY